MGAAADTRSVLDILLEGTARNVTRERPVAYYKVRRLSREQGCDVVCKLQALTYEQTALLSRSEDMDLEVVLAGLLEPDLRDVRLARHLGVMEAGKTWDDSPVTPREVVKALLLPGEVSAISRAIQQLSGFQTVSLQEVKKN